MTGKERGSKDIWIDPDDAPELDDEFFQEADQYKGEKMIRRGRPKADKTKRPHLVNQRASYGTFSVFPARG